MAKAVYDPDTIALNAFGKGLPLRLQSDIASTTIPAAVQYIRTSGYSAVGVGAAMYKRVGSQPSHPGKAQSADGAWWEIAEAIIDARMLGVTVGSNADTTMANAIATAAALKAPLGIPTGAYTFLKEVDFSALVGGKIILGLVTFDFTGATVAANFPHGSHVYVGGAALVAMQDLNLNVIKGDSSLRFFNTSHGVQPDDRFCIYNPTSGSFNGARPEYTAGEWCRALSVSGTDVALYAGTYADYATSAIDLYKHPNKPIKIDGGVLVIKESVASGFDIIAGFRADRIVDSDFSAIQPTNSLYAGMRLDQCIGIFGRGYRVVQRDVTGGNAYGVLFSNSQDCLLEGEFEGGRHGVALGGSSGPGAVPTRNVYTKGTHRNSPDAGNGIGCWNAHGCAEFCGAEGTFEGGINPGGDHMRFRGRIRLRASQRGWAIYIAENLGFNFDFEGMEIEGIGDPSFYGTVGVIDLGASSSANSANTTRGGRINLNNVKFNCPSARILVTMQNNGFTTSETMSLSLEGASWPSTNASSPLVVYTDKGSQSRVIDQLSLTGFMNGAKGAYSMNSTPLVAGWRQRGTANVTPSTSSNSVSQSISWLMPAPKPPIVQVWCADGASAGEPVIGFSGSPTTTTCTVGLITATKANFPSVAALVLSIDASLDEF
jgi:hypothetical protein